MNISTRIENLRKIMAEKKIDAYIVPSSDPHQSEYTADRWKSRAWISGFTGSAGTVVITKNGGGLWTDSRYYIQAEDELKGSGLTLFKMFEPGVPSFTQWTAQQVETGGKVGFDGRVFSVSAYKGLVAGFSSKNISIISEFDLVGDLWNDRPSVPDFKIFEHDIKYAGSTRDEKLQIIREKMKAMGIENHFIGSLDDICWIFNIRGKDVLYNPVVISYALISDKEAILFINEDKVPEELKTKFNNENIKLISYDKIVEYLNNLDSANILINPAKTNKWVFDSINNNCKVIEGANISTILKAKKNETEVENTKKALVRDGAAMVKWMYWLDSNIGKEAITEISATEKLAEFRAMGENFVGMSFGTIAGYKEHGAIVHYSSTPETNVELKEESFLLMDSGGQYFDGTTDITRTVPLGNLTDEEKRDFTLVLRGHIGLAMAKFPYGSKGVNVDSFARKPLWDAGMNYGHGTGHGIGFFLNVHEGPQNISPGLNNVTLEDGMICSNEPGLYRQGKHGIRIENLILTRVAEETEFGKFMKFDTITICPIDIDAIIPEIMTTEEKTWLNDYHKECYEKITPFLNENEKEWLRNKTREI